LKDTKNVGDTGDAQIYMEEGEFGEQVGAD
jgi:hypothetical protein